VEVVYAYGAKRKDRRALEVMANLVKLLLHQESVAFEYCGKLYLI
jgi:hypothetical protein